MKKNRRSGLRIMVSLLGLLGKLKYIIIFAVFGGYLGNSCAIAVMALGATCAAKVIDPEFTNASLGLLIALTIGAGVARGLLRFLEQYNNHYIAFKLLANLRDKIFGALRKLAPAKLEGKQKGAIIAMLTSDIETLEVFYAHTISPILIAILVDGTVVVLVSVIGSPWLGLIALASYLVIGIAIPFISSGMLRKDGVEYRAQFADSSSYFLDSVKGINDIVMNNKQEQRGAELDRQSAFMNGRTVSIKIKSASVGAVSNLAVSLTILISLLVGVVLVTGGTIQIPNMIVALVLCFSSFGPVLSLAQLPSNLTQTFASGDRILDFMEEKPVVRENEEGQKFTFESLEVKNLTFGYEDDGRITDKGALDNRKQTEQAVLKNINLKVSRGDIIGLVGESGCGKSTLLKMLLRFYDPGNGEVLYNGINLKDINTASLHENVTMVCQDTYLFDDTILANITFAKPDAGLEEVREACRKASIDTFIMSLPDGYDTEVGLLGDSLSAGEKQRIGLARAFLSGAQLILLDEVTSNVDAINEGIILRSLKEASKDATIILVSHRESTVSICSRIYHMDKGVFADE